MSINNRVIWEEGLFIRPQHFQQETRYAEHHVNHRLDNYDSFLYGLTEIEFDRQYLKFGTLVIVRASGVLPDGTCFDIPTDTPPPSPLTIPRDVTASQIVYLTLPIREQGVTEVGWPESYSNSRYTVEQKEIKDIHSREGDFTTVNVASLRLGLMLEQEDRSSYTSLAITKVTSRGTEESLLIDNDFYPTSLAVSAIPPLNRFLGEVAGLMRDRAKKLAARIGSPSQAGVAEVTDFLLLQALNRIQPKLQHLSSLRLLHPERLYETFVQACGELFTFQDGERVPDEYPAYDHENPQRCFNPLEAVLRECLGTLIQPRAESIPIRKENYGYYSALLADRSLIETADFILTVKADINLEQLQETFAQQTKVASMEKLSDLVKLQLPGIPLVTLSATPRHLPFHAGYTYFQLDQSSEEWRQMMTNTAGIAFHIAGEFSGMRMELWTIRRN